MFPSSRRIIDSSALACNAVIVYIFVSDHTWWWPGGISDRTWWRGGFISDRTWWHRTYLVVMMERVADIFCSDSLMIHHWANFSAFLLQRVVSLLMRVVLLNMMMIDDGKWYSPITIIIIITMMMMLTRWLMNNLVARLDGPSIIDLHHRTLSAQHQH